MSYREKLAWLNLAAIALAYLPYFSLVGAGYFGDQALPGLRQLGLFGICAVTHATVVAVGTILFGRAAPEEAKSPPDERELSIEHRAVRIAYFVLMSAICIVGMVMPFVSSGWAIVNAALLSIVVAELAHYGFALNGYRVLS